MSTQITSAFLELKNLRATVVVTGDTTLTHYHAVTVSRVSPEAPIPVLLSPTEHPTRSEPGGAAGVALQFARLNADVRLVSLLSPDAAAVCHDHGLDTRHCAVVPCHVPTTRVLHQDQYHCARWDTDTDHYGLGATALADVLKALAVSSPWWEADVLVASDHGHGFLDAAEFTRQAEAHGFRVHYADTHNTMLTRLR